MAKLFASESAFEIATEALRVHGGYGYTTEFPVERYYRDAPLMIIGEGTNEIQRIVIARGLPKRAEEAGLAWSWPARPRTPVRTRPGWRAGRRPSAPGDDAGELDRAEAEPRPSPGAVNVPPAGPSRTRVNGRPWRRAHSATTSATSRPSWSAVSTRSWPVARAMSTRCNPHVAR